MSLSSVKNDPSVFPYTHEQPFTDSLVEFHVNHFFETCGIQKEISAEWLTHLKNICIDCWITSSNETKGYFHNFLINMEHTPAIIYLVIACAIDEQWKVFLNKFLDMHIEVVKIKRQG